MLANLGFNRSTLRNQSQASGHTSTGSTFHKPLGSQQAPQGFVGPLRRFGNRSAASLDSTVRKTSGLASHQQMSLQPQAITPKAHQELASREFVGLKALNAPALHHRTVGELSHADRVSTAEGDRLWDEYDLATLTPGERVHVRLNSTAFDTYLKLVNGETGEILASNDDAEGQNSRLTFKVKSGIEYRLHITSYDGGAMGQYEVETAQFSPKRLKNFSFDYGHGLVNAAAAVAKAAGKNLFKNRATRWTDKVWGQEAMRVSSVWNQKITGKGVTIAVVDTGVDINHKELKGNLWRNTQEIAGNGKDDDGNGFVDDVRGWNFADNTADLTDSRDHGSHIAGIIGANKKGAVKGIAYDSKIMPIKVVGENGGSQEQVAQGIRYAVKNGADVINISLGANPGSLMSGKLKRAIRFAYRKDAVVVVASGNERQFLGATQPGEPAHYTAATATGVVVGAVDQAYTAADFSNPTGNKRSSFVAAPGTNIFSLSAHDPSGYKWRQGTSMAAAHVSGVVALMKSANPDLSSRKMIRILTQTANKQIVSKG